MTSEPTYSNDAIAKGLAGLIASGKGQEAHSQLSLLAERSPGDYFEVFRAINYQYSYGQVSGEMRRLPLGRVDAQDMRSVFRAAVKAMGDAPDASLREKMETAAVVFFERMLTTEDAARVDVGTLIAGEAKTDAQRRSMKHIENSQTLRVVDLINELPDESRFNIADRLLDWGEQNTGSLPPYFRMQLTGSLNAAHQQMREAEIAKVVTLAEAAGLVRPASPVRAKRLAQLDAED